MLKKYYYLLSGSLDPYYNLAVEEYILEHIGRGECMLYLYQNKHTVVIGKHQNPWRECKTDLLESEKGKLARRISGGGAVYHDMGNLNFSFIMDKEEYDVQKQLSVIVDAVNSAGILAVPSGRNDITIEGRKFSGNAFCHKKFSSFHHGTILVSSDFSFLGKYLQVSKEKIQSKGISSVQARVVNLNEYNPDVTVADMIKAVKASFEKVYGKTEDYPFKEDANANIEKLTQRNSAYEWQYGQTPHFDIELESRFDWGGVTLLLKIKDARVECASVYTDSLNTDFADVLRQSLVGCPFNSAALFEMILSLPVNPEEKAIFEDIAGFIKQKGF